MMKMVSKRDEDRVEDEDGWRRWRVYKIEEDGGMYNDEEDEDGACRLERNAQG
jgi:hypothetical protein